MNFPNWIPQVPRPADDDHGKKWDAMTENQRRGSFLADMAIVASLLVAVAAWWVR